MSTTLKLYPPVSESSSFKPSDIYPCSLTCATQRIPCPKCLESSSTSFDTPQSSASFLPRQCLRLPFSQFLQAVRDRLIEDVAEASRANATSRSVARLKDGFVLGTSTSSSEWGSGWEHHSRTRPLIHCQLQIHLSHYPSTPTKLVIHPILKPTYYLTLHRVLPVPPGTPIVLLPHGAPAYYLSTYAGPTAALTAQFEDALLGYGAGNWKCSSDQLRGSTQETSTYIIAWLAVQNKQGEEKGIPLIWPLRLCLSYHRTSPSTHARSPLKYIPELAAQLQASPPPPAPTMSFSGALPASSSAQSTSHSSRNQVLSPPMAILKRPSIMSSPTSNSLRSFRTMVLSSRPDARSIKKVAAEVSGYVDAVAKERERERERIRREREGKDKAPETPNQKERSEGSILVPQSSNIPSAPVEVSLADTLQSSSVVTEQIPEITPVQPAVVMSPRIASPIMEDVRSNDNSMTGLFSPPEMTLDELPADEDVSAQFKNDEPEATAMDVQEEVREGPAQAPEDSIFDSFDNFDAAWQSTSEQYKDEFMDMNMDYNIGFQMNLQSFGGGREAASDAGGFDVDNGFGVFTEDDFDFFDGPPVPARVTAAPSQGMPSLESGSGLTPAAGPAPLGLSPQVLGDSVGIAGPGPPSAVHAQSSPWAAQPLGEAFVQRIPDNSHLGSNMLVAPELLPPTPGKSPSSSSAPPTPTVHLSDPFSSAKSGHYTSGLHIFDPIPFAPSHKAVDGKYAIGKFALPSPPDEEDRTEPMIFASSSPFSKSNIGWKERYSEVTDPRIGMIRKLIGVKRKSFDQGIRDRRSPAWMHQFEEWERSPSPQPDESKSDADSDDEPWIEDEDARTVSRPSTPPPSYLPLGPTLLHTHFHHAHLLPLSTPLRPPGLAVSSSSSGTVPVSVPTPVSPAAVLGATSERSRSLEAAVQILVKEVIENYVWAEAWQVNTGNSVNNTSPPTDVWQSDVKRVAELFTAVENTQTLVDVGTLASAGKRDQSRLALEHAMANVQYV